MQYLMRKDFPFKCLSCFPPEREGALGIFLCLGNSTVQSGGEGQDIKHL